MKMSKLATVLLGVCAGTSTVAFAVEDMTNVLPDAKAGECYAKVLTPPVFRTESASVVTREASEQVKIIPAEYRWTEQKILTSEAGSQLQVIPAKYSTESYTYEVSPASTQWVVGSRNSHIGANPAMLQVAIAGGANMDAAKAGECYHEHYQPAKFKTVTERVLVSEASSKIDLVDAKYEWTEQRIMIQPERRQLVEIPATYETIQERVLVESAKTVWKKGRGGIERIDNSSGDIMCLVEVPAVYKTVTKRVVKTPAGTKMTTQPAKFETVKVKKLVQDAREQRVEIPAKYKEVTKRVQSSDARHVWHEVRTKGSFGDKTGNIICKREIPAKTATVTRQVVKTPAAVQRVEIPAKYATKRVSELVSEAREERVTLAAKTSEINKRVMVSPSRLEWRSILCQTNMTTDNIRRVQTALKKAGYNPGPIDGYLGAASLNAVERFQNANSMATGGLTYETLSKLGVSITK